MLHTFLFYLSVTTATVFLVFILAVSFLFGAFALLAGDNTAHRIEGTASLAVAFVCAAALMTLIDTLG